MYALKTALFHIDLPPLLGGKANPLLCETGAAWNCALGGVGAAAKPLLLDENCTPLVTASANCPLAFSDNCWPLAEAEVKAAICASKLSSN